MSSLLLLPDRSSVRLRSETVWNPVLKMYSKMAEEATTQLTEVADQVFGALMGIRREHFFDQGNIEEELGKLESIIMKHSTHKHLYVINKLIRPTVFGPEWNLEFANQVSVACKELHFNKVSVTTCQFRPEHILQLGKALESILDDPEVKDDSSPYPIGFEHTRLFVLTFCQEAETGWDMP